MRNHVVKGILAGAAVTLYFYAVVSFIFFIVHFRYNETNSFLCSLVIYLLPALSGILSFFLLKSDCLKNFYKKLAGYLLASLLVFGLLIGFRFTHCIYLHLTGFGEISNGEGLLMVVTGGIHIICCLLAFAIANLVSSVKQSK